MPEIIRNTLRLAYEEAGSGGPPLLCVHGFGGSSRHFTPQLEHFSKRQRTVAIDRRGHGSSDRAEGPYSIPDIAEEVIWTAHELGMHKPVLVVHSMGAIGFEVTNQAPELLSALVLIDAPLLPPEPVRQMFSDLLNGLRTPHYREVIDGMCERLIFLPSDDKTRRANLHSALLQTPQQVLAATWQHFIAYDIAPAASRCKLPLLYIGSVMPFDEVGMRQLCPQLQVGRCVGTGHFPQLEVPEQVNAMIDKFLSISLHADR
jgi:pimeloyl-ACP methyl ester carboxylesterase